MGNRIVKGARPFPTWFPMQTLMNDTKPLDSPSVEWTTLPQHGYRGKSSRHFSSPVRKEKICPAAGAESRCFDVLIPEASFPQLPSTDFPQIKVVLLGHETMKILRKQVLVGDKFSTARTQRRTDGGPQILRFASEFPVHPAQYSRQEITGVPAPTAVNVGQNPFDGIVKNHGLTIGLPDRDGHFSQIGDDGICPHRLPWKRSPQNPYVRAVYLVYKSEMFGSHSMANDFQIRADPLFPVTGAEARVQRVERGRTHAPLTGKHGMHQLRELGKPWELEVGHLKEILGIG